MSTPQTEDDVVDLADVAHEIFVYDAETVRRDAQRIGGRPAPALRTSGPGPTEFTD